MNYPTAGDLAMELQNRLAAVAYRNEDDLQAAISNAIAAEHQREVRLSDHQSRIDLYVPTADPPNRPYPGGTPVAVLTAGIGIEVKVDGSLEAVTRQLTRYAACPEIEALILVTTRARHNRIPTTIGARRIPLHLVTLYRNGL